MLNGSNNADSCKDVPFGGFVDAAAYLGGQIPLRPQISTFGVWIGVFKQNVPNIETFILSKLLHRSHHQLQFVGGPNMLQTNPRWWRGEPPPWKIKKIVLSQRYGHSCYRSQTRKPSNAKVNTRQHCVNEMPITDYVLEYNNFSLKIRKI